MDAYQQDSGTKGGAGKDAVNGKSAVSGKSAALAQQVISRWGGLKNDRAVWDTLWQDIADYVLPRKAEIHSRTKSPGTSRADVLFDTTAVYANQTLANGQMT